MTAFPFQASEPPAPGRGVIGVFFILAFLIFMFIMARRRARGTAGVTIEEGRRELDRLRREGARDVATEAHLGALFSWCGAYLLLTLFMYVVAGFTEPRVVEDAARRYAERDTSRVFAVLVAIEAAGLWMSVRGMQKGREASRWAASGLLTMLALSTVAMALFQFDRQVGAARVSNLVLNCCVALYAATGATYLLLPGSARLCSPEYRQALQANDSPAARVALNLARTKSPFSWGPIVVLLGTVLLGELLKRAAGGN